MLRLSAKLNAERQGIIESDTDLNYISAVEGQDPKPDRKTPRSSAAVVPVKSLTVLPSRRKKQTLGHKKAAAESRFRTQNIFASLQQNEDSELDSSSSSSSEEEEKQSDTAWQDEVYQPDTSSWHPIETVQRQPMELIPAFDAGFWGEFGNTLRIYGTEEGVLRIAKWEV